jgi:hypothetical protein
LESVKGYLPDSERDSGLANHLAMEQDLEFARAWDSLVLVAVLAL